MKVTKIFFIVILFFFIIGCATTQKKSGCEDLPVDALSKLLNVDSYRYLGEEELKKYIILKDYNFRVLKYNVHDMTTNFTIAVTNDKSIFFFLNYPDMFSFNNFNTVIRSEKYNIPDLAIANLYMKFLAKLFMPEMISFDEIENAMTNGSFPNNPGLLKLKDKYGMTVSFEGSEYINANFYTISKDFLIYNWQTRVKNNGMLIACKVDMLMLDAEFKQIDLITIFNKIVKNGTMKEEE